MSDTDINATVNVTEDIYADVDSTAMSAAVIDDGDSIVVPAEVDFGQTLDTELEDNDLIDVPVDESVGIAGDHRVLLHRDAANQHPMSAITGLNETIAGINTALSDRITQVEAETADLDVDMASALLRIGDLQDQVDGNITTWFYAAEPAMNLPPVALDPSNPHDTGWDTIDKKNAHRGDLYYNTLTGYAYRFAYADGDFGWMRITDTDVVKALADAARAQDTADSKRRVFYTTPYPPYDKGDLWVQGTSGDILVCSTSKPADGSYDFADWSRASKYTDDTVADIALASANGKNTVYHQASQPTGGTYKKGDTWFDTDDDYTMYTYDGSVWVKEQFGNEAIADLSITNGKIANATIEYGKIKSVDAGKITVGDLSANRIKASVITAVNSSTETSGGSSLKISADKVNIEGATIFTSGRLSTTSLDNAYDANGAAADALSDAKDYADDTAADALADAKGYADTAVSDKAGKSDAVARTQRIYYRKTASGAPSKNTTWLSTSGTGYGNWSLKIPQMTSGTTKYPYLYTAVQTQTVSQLGGTTCSCSDVLLDDTTTVIDGGTIITGSLNANRIGAGDISADRMKVNSISAINGNTGTVKISAEKVEIDGATTFTAIKSQTDAAYDAKGSASAVQTNLDNLEIGGTNLLRGTSTQDTSLGNNRENVTATTDKLFGCTVFKSSSAWADIGFNFKTQLIDTGKVMAGDVLTYSIWSKCDDTTARTLFGIWISKTSGGNYIGGTAQATLTSGWKQYSYTFTVTADMLTDYATWTRWECNTTTTSGYYVYWAAPKVERGNKATAWSPAPEDVQAEIDAKKSTHTLMTANSAGANYTAILSLSADGYSGNWGVVSTSGVKVGDTVRIGYPVSDMSMAVVYVVGTVTAVTNSTNLTMTSHGLDTTIINGGNILTNSIGANQIAANAISIGKLDSSTQTKVSNGDSALSKVNYYNRTCLVGNSTNTQTKYWRKFASYAETRTNVDPYIIFDVMTSGDFGSGKRFGRLKAHVRTSSPAGTVEANRTTLEWISRGEGIVLTDFVLAYKATSGTDVKLELWCRCPRSWEGYRFNMVQEGDRTIASTSAMWTLHDSWTADGVESITSGYTQVTSTDTDAARTTATSYITDIDSNNGITIKAVNGATSGSDTTKQNYIKLNADGLDIYQEGTSVAHYGDYARIGKDGEANTIISSDEVVISASDNINALRITPDGNVVTSDVTKLINHSFASGKTYTYEHPSSADANSLIRYRIKEKSRRYRTIEVRNGISTAETSITQPFSFKYSSTPTSITIKNTGTNTLTLERVVYKVTTISPLTKVGGVLVLGQNPDIESTTVIAVGNGSEEAPYSAFQVTKLGDIYIRGNCVNDFVIEEGEWDIWTYRKWHSGVAECWGTHTATLSHIATVFGGYSYQTSVNFPSGLFADLPVVTYSAYISNLYALTGTINNSFSKNTVTLYAVSNGSGSKTTVWRINAKGKWK